MPKVEKKLRAPAYRGLAYFFLSGSAKTNRLLPALGLQFWRQATSPTLRERHSRC